MIWEVGLITLINVEISGRHYVISCHVVTESPEARGECDNVSQSSSQWQSPRDHLTQENGSVLNLDMQFLSVSFYLLMAIKVVHNTRPHRHRCRQGHGGYHNHHNSMYLNAQFLSRPIWWWRGRDEDCYIMLGKHLKITFLFFFEY